MLYHCYIIVISLLSCAGVRRCHKLKRYPFPLGTSDNLGLFPHLDTLLTVLENTNTVVVDRHKPRVFCFYKHRQKETEFFTPYNSLNFNLLCKGVPPPSPRFATTIPTYCHHHPHTFGKNNISNNAYNDNKKGTANEPYPSVNHP